MPRDEANRLILADRVWRAVQGLLRITGGRIVPMTLPDATSGLVQRVLDRLAPSGPLTIEDRLDVVAAGVRDAFARHVGEIGP